MLLWGQAGLRLMRAVAAAQLCQGLPGLMVLADALQHLVGNVEALAQLVFVLLSHHLRHHQVDTGSGQECILRSAGNEVPLDRRQADGLARSMTPHWLAEA